MKTLALIMALLVLNKANSQVTDTTLYGYRDSTLIQTEITPVFIGGPMAWKKYLEKNIEITGIPGTVIIEFTIEKDGHILKDSKIYKSDNPELNKEALRLIKGSRWIPAIQNGKPVIYRMRQPIEFK
jgi:protein TonB